MDSDLASILSSPSELGAAARDQTNPELQPQPLETPADTQQRVARTQIVKAKNLADAGLPSWQEPNGIVQPVTDATGAPLTHYDKAHGIAYDSAGNPNKVNYDGHGAPVLSDPLADAPIVSKKNPDTGLYDRYKTPAGLPWQYVEPDEVKNAKIAAAESQKATNQAASALGRQLSSDEGEIVRGNSFIRASKKRLLKDVPIDPTLLGEDPKTVEGDPAAVHAAIDQHFDEQYALPENNEKGSWLGGDLSDTAKAARLKLDQQKAQAHARADQLFTTQDAVAQKTTLREQRMQVEQQLRTQQLREAAKRAGLTIPGLEDTQISAPPETPEPSATPPDTQGLPSTVASQGASPTSTPPAEASPAIPGMEPEGALASGVRQALTGVFPAIGAALGGRVGTLASGLAGAESGPADIPIAIAGGLVAAGAGAALGKKAQDHLMGGEWTAHNQAQLDANMAAHPIASKIGAFIPAVVSMLGGAGPQIEKAAAGYLERIAQSGATPTFIQKAIAALPENMVIGARMGTAAASENLAEGKGSATDLINEAVKGAVTMGPVAFVPGASTLLGAALGKAPADAAVLATSNALYDRTVKGTPIDFDKLKEDIGTDIPGFVLMNLFSSLTHGHPIFKPSAPESGAPPPEPTAPPSPPSEPAAPSTSTTVIPEATPVPVAEPPSTEAAITTPATPEKTTASVEPTEPKPAATPGQIADELYKLADHQRRQKAWFEVRQHMPEEMRNFLDSAIQKINNKEPLNEHEAGAVKHVNDFIQEHVAAQEAEEKRTSSNETPAPATEVPPVEPPKATEQTAPASTQPRREVPAGMTNLGDAFAKAEAAKPEAPSVPGEEPIGTSNKGAPLEKNVADMLMMANGDHEKAAQMAEKYQQPEVAAELRRRALPPEVEPSPSGQEQPPIAGEERTLAEGAAAPAIAEKEPPARVQWTPAVRTSDGKYHLMDTHEGAQSKIEKLGYKEKGVIGYLSTDGRFETNYLNIARAHNPDLAQEAQKAAEPEPKAEAPQVPGEAPAPKAKAANKLPDRVTYKGGSPKEYSKSSTQVTLPEKDAKVVRDFAATIPESEIYTDPEDPTFGRESDPHITALYGITSESPSKTAKALKENGPIRATLGKLSLFKNEKYDVLKAEVQSPDLHSVNGKLRKSVDFESDYPDHHPHMTVAYLKPGEGAKYVGKTPFKGREFTFNELEFRAKDGKIYGIDLANKEKPPTVPGMESAAPEAPASKKTFKRKIPQAPGGADDLIDRLVSDIGQIKHPDIARREQLNKEGKSFAGKTTNLGGEWDQWMNLPPMLRKLIFSKTAKVHPEDAARDAYREGMIREESPDALREALLSAWNSRVSNRAAEREQVKGGKSAEKVSVEQKKDFARESQMPGVKDEKIASDELHQGYTVKINGESMKVIHVDEDGSVMLEDGSRYGIQTIESGEAIYGELEHGQAHDDGWLNEVDPVEEEAKVTTPEQADEYASIHDLQTNEPAAAASDENAPKGPTDDQGQNLSGQAESGGEVAVPKLEKGQDQGDLLSGPTENTAKTANVTNEAGGTLVRMGGQIVATLRQKGGNFIPELNENGKALSNEQKRLVNQAAVDYAKTWQKAKVREGARKPLQGSEIRSQADAFDESKSEDPLFQQKPKSAHPETKKVGAGFVPPKFEIKKPIEGPTGAKIVGYEWRSHIDDVWSESKGETVARRVSDWSSADESAGTGRSIVHVFYVEHPDGKTTIEGVNSAQNILGISQTKLQAIAKHEQAAQRYAEETSRQMASEISKSASTSESEADAAYRRANHPDKMMWGTREQHIEASDESFRNSTLLTNGKKYFRTGLPDIISSLKEHGWEEAKSTGLKSDDPKSISDTAPAKGILSQHVQVVADRLGDKFAGAARTIVAPDGSYLPDAVKDAAKAKGITDLNRIGGVYYDGTVYLNSAGIESPKRAAEIWFHEHAGHVGVSKLLEGISRGSEQTLADTLRESFPADWEHVAARYNPSEHVDETLARIMERVGTMDAPERSAWRKVVDFIRTTLAKAGLKSWSEEDVQALLRRGLDRIREPSAHHSEFQERDETGRFNGPPKFSTEDDVTSTKRDWMRAAREARGELEIATIDKPKREELIAQAKLEIERHPDAALELIREINDTDGPLKISTPEEAVLAAQRRILETQRNDAAERALDKTLTETQRQVARERFSEINGEIDDLDHATNKTGASWSGWGRFRMQELKKDFSFAQIEKRIRAAMGDRETTPADVQQWQKWADEIKATTEAKIKRMEEMHAEERTSAVNAAVEQAKSDWAKNQPDPRIAAHSAEVVGRIKERLAPSLDKARSFFNAAKGKGAKFSIEEPAKPEWFQSVAEHGATKLAEQRLSKEEWFDALKKDIGDTKGETNASRDALWKESNAILDRELEADKKKNPSKPIKKDTSKDEIVQMMQEKVDKGTDVSEMGRFVKKLAERLVGEGIDKREPLVGALHAEMQKVVPGIDRETVQDLFSDYGQFHPATTEALKVKVAQLRSEVQQSRKIIDMLKGQAPAATGIGRVPPSDEHRALTKQVEDLKRRGGFKVTDPERQLKTALDSIKTRLRNEIADMDLAISNRKPMEGKKHDVTFDPETTALKARRDAKKAEYEQQFPKDEKQARLDAVNRALDKSITDLEVQLKAGKLYPDQPGPKLTSPEIEAKRARLDALRDERNVLRGLDSAKVEAEQAKAVSERIAELEKERAAGWPDDKTTGRPTADTPELAKLKSERDALLKERSKAKNPPKDEEAKRLDALDRAIAAKEAKIAAGDISSPAKSQNVKTEAVSAKEAKLRELNAELSDLRKKSETRWLDQRKALKSRQLAQSLEKLASGDIHPKPKPSAQFKPDKELRDLTIAEAKAKQQIADRIYQEQHKNRNVFQKVTGWVAALNRANVLSGVASLEHLTGAALENVVTRPVGTVLAQAMRAHPTLDAIRRKAQYEGTISTKSELAGVRGLINSFRGGRTSAFFEKLKNGESAIDYENSTDKWRVKEFGRIIGQVHGAIKEPVRQGIYARSVELGIKHFEDQGIDPRKDEVLLQAIQKQAYDNANMDIFMGDNFLTKTIHGAINGILRGNKADPGVAKFAADVFDILFPILNVPTNIAIRKFRLLTGLGEGAGRLLYHGLRGDLANGAEKLTSRDAEIITRALKYGAFGLAMSVYAWQNPQRFGGIWAIGKQAPHPHDLPPGDIKLPNGQVLSHHLAHGPVGGHLNMVADARRLYDKLKKEGPKTPWSNMTETAFFSMFAGAKDLAVISTPARWASPFKSAGAKAGEIVKSIFIPRAVQDFAKWQDGKERKATTFSGELKSAIPGLRQSLPVRKDNHQTAKEPKHLIGLPI